MSVGSDSPMRGEPLLRWMNPLDAASTLFTLDDATKSMEWESPDVGITSMLEALNHAMGALCDVVIPSGRVLLGPASLLLALIFLYILFVS